MVADDAATALAHDPTQPATGTRRAVTGAPCHNRHGLQTRDPARGHAARRRPPSRNRPVEVKDEAYPVSPRAHPPGVRRAEARLPATTTMLKSNLTTSGLSLGARHSDVVGLFASLFPARGRGRPPPLRASPTPTPPPPSHPSPPATPPPTSPLPVSSPRPIQQRASSPSHMPTDLGPAHLTHHAAEPEPHRRRDLNVAPHMSHVP